MRRRRHKRATKFYIKDLPIIKQILSVLLCTSEDSDIVSRAKKLRSELKKCNRVTFDFEEAAVISLAAATYMENFKGNEHLRDLYRRALYNVVYKTAAEVVGKVNVSSDKTFVGTEVFMVGDVKNGTKKTNLKTTRNKVLLDKS